MKTINYEKFINWLEEMEAASKKAAKKAASKGNYAEALENSNEADIYYFIRFITQEEGVDMPPFIEVPDGKTEI